MDETYVRIRGQWKYLYRAVDKAGNTIDFLLTAKRDRKAALRFLCKAVGQHGTPVKITIDGGGANSAAIEDYNEEHDAEVEIRQVKYLADIFDKFFFPFWCCCDWARVTAWRRAGVGNASPSRAYDGRFLFAAPVR
jgi:transposase-like protein